MPPLNNFPILFCLQNGSKKHKSHLTQQGSPHAVKQMNKSQKVFINSELFIQYPVVESNNHPSIRMTEAVNTELLLDYNVDID